MKTDIIYRSVVKETGEEVLVYKNIFDKYRDFRTTREFSKEELKNFISLTKILGFTTSVNKDSAIQLYYSCINAELFHHSVYIGDIAIIKKSDNRNENSNYTFEIIKYNRVFRKWNGVYIDMEDFESYREDNFRVGEKIIVNFTLINELFNNELPGSKTARPKILAFCQKKFSQLS